ncbi:MAG: glycosyltransferase family 2 protein [Flavobacteriaceae bacterium]|nr:glycosyltransferase family 2 protein [Flavobacteriaceae bacterium]
MDGVSVILCCYNSASRLSETLGHLAKQKVPENVNWELVLVDNNSTDNTAEVARQYWSDAGSVVPLNIIMETKPGLSFARNAGMQAAKYDIFLFCDDDNWLDPDYVGLVYANFDQKNKLAALGGWCDPVFEVEKPDWFDTFSGNFAVGKPIPESGYLNRPQDYLYGAGFAISRTAKQALDNKGFKNVLSDRKGKQLSSGGDVETIFALKIMKLPVYFDERLHFQHFMPDGRMNWDYLLRIRESMYWSNFVLGIYIDSQRNIPFGLKGTIKKVVSSARFILRNKKRFRQMDRFKQLFLKNQLKSRSYYLSNLYFYLKTRKTIERLKND